MVFKKQAFVRYSPLRVSSGLRGVGDGFRRHWKRFIHIPRVLHTLYFFFFKIKLFASAELRSIRLAFSSHPSLSFHSKIWPEVSGTCKEWTIFCDSILVFTRKFFWGEGEGVFRLLLKYVCAKFKKKIVFLPFIGDRSYYSSDRIQLRILLFLLLLLILPLFLLFLVVKRPTKHV